MSRRVNSDVELIDLVNDKNAAPKRRSKKDKRKSADPVETVVLVHYWNSMKKDEEQKLITLEGSLLYSDMPLILRSIFPNEEVLKDHLGYKLVNVYTEQRLETKIAEDVLNKVHKINYLVEVKVPTVRIQDINDFSKQLESEKFSDVILRVGDKVIYAHKIILANKSSVFNSMFIHDTLDIQSNEVVIKDLSFDTTRDMLRYIYTRKLSEDVENGVFSQYLGLLAAADKYGVESLKTRCEEKLPLFLTTENVLDCLLLSHSHNALNLKKEAIDFIVANADEIINSSLYEEFLQLDSTLSFDIVRALVAEKKNTEPTAKKKKT